MWSMRNITIISSTTTTTSVMQVPHRSASKATCKHYKHEHEQQKANKQKAYRCLYVCVRVCVCGWWLFIAMLLSIVIFG